MRPVPSTTTKTYPQRGPLQQFRFGEATAFICFRCGDSKKAKLITVYNGDWSKRLCNGCYGRLLFLYEIKAGTAADDQRADELAAALLSAVALHDQHEAERLFKASEMRAANLSAEAMRFVATAEHVARHLQADTHLEWSPAVIGLCKAVEAEIVFRIVQPLATRASNKELQTDRSDKDLGRIADFCADPTRRPPELGGFAHFLQTVIHSQRRRETSVLIGSFFKLVADWTGSHWILDPMGLHRALVLLTTDYRNRAAHIDELGKQDYLNCRELVIGADGALWRLLLATQSHR